MTFILRPYSDTDRAVTALINVDPGQQVFVEPISEILDARSERDNYVIEADGSVIGFFQIDHSSKDRIFFDHVTLHEVMIDHRHQGNGYGRAFVDALPAFLKTSYPDHASICLTVNCRNPGAKKIYEYGGFEDTGELKLDGPSGPQFIMRRDL